MDKAPFEAGDIVKEKEGMTGVGGRGGNTYLVTGSHFNEHLGGWCIHVRRWIKKTQKYSGTGYSLRASVLERA